LAEAAMALREQIVQEIYDKCPDLHAEVGVPVFDTLDPKTQVFALSDVLRHLSEPDLPSPDLYAWNEGTAYAMFVSAEDELDMEIEFEKDPEAADDLKFRFWKWARKRDPPWARKRDPPQCSR
jgi:hypothetical protein